MRNGTLSALPAPLRANAITIDAYDPSADLDAWDSAIADLSAALHEAASARMTLDETALVMERIEASHILDIDGGNAERRKARLTLALADDGRYQDARSRHQEARHSLLDAERHITVSKERCRLLRVSLELLTHTNDR